jgi:C4-dicarboxylate-specific signal transduction histidine kinase
MRDMIKKGEAQLEARDLNADLQQVLLLLGGDLMERNVSVDTALAPGLPKVRGDHIQLQQVLLNLIINGCDSMQAIPIAERRILIETTRENERFARVSVIDRGAGIAPAMMERMFEPFFSTKSQGLGMGLSICRAIIKAHGGQLWAENNRDRGASFHFTLRVGEQETE